MSFLRRYIEAAARKVVRETFIDGRQSALQERIYVRQSGGYILGTGEMFMWPIKPPGHWLVSHKPLSETEPGFTLAEVLEQLINSGVLEIEITPRQSAVEPKLIIKPKSATAKPSKR